MCVTLLAIADKLAYVVQSCILLHDGTSIIVGVGNFYQLFDE